jgi:hypothetical protein
MERSQENEDIEGEDRESGSEFPDDGPFAQRHDVLLMLALYDQIALYSSERGELNTAKRRDTLRQIKPHLRPIGYGTAI